MPPPKKIIEHLKQYSQFSAEEESNDFQLTQAHITDSQTLIFDFNKHLIYLSVGKHRGMMSMI